MKQVFVDAFKISIPILAGYIFLGTAFGMFAQSSGLSFWEAISMSLFIYAGSMQFAAVPLLISPLPLFQIIVLTLSINARHLFYGFSMAQSFTNEKRRKPYMIFALTDESFSLLVDQKNRPDLMFWILLFNHIYWIIGTIIGFLFGNILPFALEGIEFAMTSLFLVIFLNRLKENQLSAMTIGMVASLFSLWVFGKNHFIIPAMFFIITSLAGLERKKR